jgi:hypothetical protein
VIFHPSRGEAREFFFDVWAKHRAGTPLTPLEAMALDIVLGHPEYRPMLEDRERYLERDWKPEGGETNPFLHLAMHLAIAEQVSIDQPPGIRDVVHALARRRDSVHDARHDVMECLAEMIWKAQRYAEPFDNEAYLDCLRRR